MTDVMKIIRNERHRQGLSQVDLAKKIYVHPTSVSFWESYRFSPKFDIVEDMLNALGMEIIIQKKEPKDESQYDFGEYADRLWKIAYERGKREALEQTEPTISKMEQVEDEPQRDCFLCKWLGDVDVCGRCRNRNLFAEADTEPKPKDEPQTERR